LFGTANDDGRSDRLVLIDKRTGGTEDRGRIRGASGYLNDFEALTSTSSGALIGIRGGGSKTVFRLGHDGEAELLSILTMASDYEAVSCTDPEKEILPGLRPNSGKVFRNYPNPFNPSTDIIFSLPAESPVRLVIYDLLGREISLLIDEVLPQGVHQARFRAGGLPSGTYVYILFTPAEARTGTMLLVR
jgi:hypothetical protein